jgi:gliding motility associated protien GldN
MSLPVIKNMLSWVDTNMVEDPLNPDGPLIQVYTPNELTSNLVKQYWIKEDWFFDKQRSVMDVRIIGLCPLQEKQAPGSNTVMGYKPLFWLYFPQCRELFARSEVFNTKNDALRCSLDDVFYKRMFSSYVRKESNVYDRSISDYAVEIDALLESDRVHDDIARMEHDVWHL